MFVGVHIFFLGTKEWFGATTSKARVETEHRNPSIQHNLDNYFLFIVNCFLIIIMLLKLLHLCLYMFVCIFFLGTEVSSEATTIEPG
jgi:hypothetical protein